MGEIVSDRRRGDPALSHRMTDLIEARNHVSGGI
jgi:hypothetical protein